MVRSGKLQIELLEQRLLPSAGDLDVVFGGGKVTAGFASGPAQVHGLAVEPDGRIITVGQAGSPNATFALARFNRNGTLDQTFANGGEVTTGLGSSQNGLAEAVAVQSDGKIVVAGLAGSGGSNEFALARYNPDGSLDTTNFGSGTGKVTTDFSGHGDLAAARPGRQ